MIFMIEENRVGELVQGNHRNQINHSSDILITVQTKKNSFSMQNNEYREWLLHGCSLMEQTIYRLFCSAMDLSFTGELKDVLYPGEEVELSSDILLTMEDPLIQRIGKTVEESIQLLNSIKNINDLADITTHSLLHNNADVTEAAAIAAPQLSYTEQLTAIINYLESATLQMQHAIWELSAYNETYAMANITDVATSNIYLDGDDMNIGFMSAFVRGIGELREEMSGKL